MTQRTIITLIDDLDGSELERGFGDTIRFGIDGLSSEIDLGEDNAAARSGPHRKAPSGTPVT